MIIIQCGGGLGNQLFIYALYLKIKHLGKNVKIDDLTVYSSNPVRDLELQKLGLEYERATRKEIDALITDKSMTIGNRMRRKILGRNDGVFQEKEQKFYREILFVDEGYLIGAWQSEKYFIDIQDKLRREIDFFHLLDEKNLKLLTEIRRWKSVSIHVRRGDYLQVENQKLFGNICDENYYKWAIRYMHDKIPDAHYFIFTNDVRWARGHFQGTDFTIVDLNSEEDGYRDLCLMSCCENHIIANSSFSWWGSWLNPNPEKIVIAPSRWYKTVEAEDIYCDGWIIPDNSWS